MPRANRYYLPGHVWHLTHRCHKREFLLKFARDRRRWKQWLFEACKRFNVSVLNYTVTCNHIHLLVFSGEDRMAIPKGLQLIAGRTAQEYNLRKMRKGAFWEDRYHATAIETDEHLKRCLIYIDLNMVRAGVVQHPVEWECGGYHEILSPPQRYRIIDRARLAALLRLPGVDYLKARHKEAVNAALRSREFHRHQPEWSEAVGVGSPAYLEHLQAELGLKVRHRKQFETDYRDAYVLREPPTPYHAGSVPETGILSLKNTLFWSLNGSS